MKSLSNINWIFFVMLAITVVIAMLSINGVWALIALATTQSFYWINSPILWAICLVVVTPILAVIQVQQN